MIDWLFANWVPVTSTGIGVISLACSIRWVEIRIRQKRTDERKELYGRIRALELSQSDQRSETKRIDESLTNSYKELREGCQVLERQVNDCVKISNHAAGYVKGCR